MLKERLKKIYIFRHTLIDMATKQLKAKYAGSLLGIWWAIITPLILAVSINFVFNVVFKINIPNYTLFVLSGIIPWFYFTNSLSEVTNSFVINANVLKQSLFPREFIPLSCILAHLLNFFIGFTCLLPLFIIINFRILGILPLLFLIIILHSLFIIGFGFLFSVVNIFFRDLSHFLSTAFMVWFWITPVFYSLNMLAFPLRWVCLLNPMTYFVIIYQSILFEAKTPNLLIISIAFSISIISFFTGYIIFVKKEPMLLKNI